MARVSLRLIIWPFVVLCALATFAGVLVFLPKNYPDATLTLERAVTSLMEEITLPIRLAQLSLQEPDAFVLLPVYGAKMVNVGDTWHAPRGADRLHEGQDIFAPKGTPVFSGTRGYVRRIGDTALGGINVIVTGAGGRRYYYAHLDRVADGLAAGRAVTTDTVLGFVGNTGNAATTPPHLHFGIYQGREAINPHGLLRDR
jgi:murein DD-endopeptidase MepM/ murein hydrolase activator NlpD